MAEKRGFVQRTQYGADVRRAGIGLTAEGRRVARSDVLAHGGNIRRHVLDSPSPEQTSLIRAWSEEAIDRLEPHRSEPSSDGGSYDGDS
ncbi:hypothetical protein ACIO53_04960 [Streptomyces sp. NPDC087305]|uniref:hypothetical protein n=1 Tax=Streptomyces sp. NPDC087305 TaxID=3365781 RepID=UPI00381164A4